jgi:hypothetical protein
MVSIRYEETTPISMRVGELPVGELRDESSKKDYECFNTPPLQICVSGIRVPAWKTSKICDLVVSNNER